MTKTEITDYDPFSGPELVAVTPLTEAQKEIWISTVIDKNASLCYNLSFTIRFKGKIHIELLLESINELVRRHESLRLTVSADGDSMDIYSDIKHEIQIVDVSDYNSDEWIKLVSEKADVLFDLENGPLFRSCVFRHNVDEYTLLMTFHHIICDGWSMDVLLQDLSQIYSAKLYSKESSLKSPSQFSEYVEHILNREYLENSAIDYWKRVYSKDIPVLDLPVDFNRPLVRTYDASRRVYKIDNNYFSEIKILASKTQCSLFSVLLTAWAIQIANLTNQNDIVIGVPFAGQPGAGMDNLVGHCVSLLPIMIHIDKDISFIDQVRDTKSKILDAYDHQHVSFGAIIKNLRIRRDPSRIPLISVCFTHTQKVDEDKLLFGDCGVDYYQPARIAETFEIHLEALEFSNGMDLLCQYNTSLFKPETIDNHLAGLEKVIRTGIANPDLSINELRSGFHTDYRLNHDKNYRISSEEKFKILNQWNNTDRNYDLSICLHKYFELQVEKTPDQTAIIFQNKSVTYNELNQMANRLARYLVSIGTGPDKIVGVYMERSIEMVVSLYAILKAGGAYLPLSLDLPETRIRYMIGDAEPVIVLTHPNLEKNLIDSHCSVLPIDSGLSSIDGFDSSNLNISVKNENLAYCIYTSGSTGMPKGVLIEHRGICNRLLWMQEYFGLTASDRVLQKTPFDFDVSVWEFFWPLISGATLVVAEPGGHRDSAYLLKTIMNENITIIHFVPTMLGLFLNEQNVAACSTLRYVICSGEALTYPMQQRFLRTLNCGLYNLYGPTEASVDVTYWECSSEYINKIVPIGFPVANTKMYILDETRQHILPGESGDLYIGGVQLARGYINRKDLTNERFIADPFSTDPGARLYNTGDRARWLEDGAIEYLGRSDNQIKFHGLRIEPGEIEYAIEQYPSVIQAVVTPRGAGENMELVAYYTLKAGEFCDHLSLRNFLKEKISQSVIPSVFIGLQSFPTTASGKIDRKALPEPIKAVTVMENIPVILTKIEEQILAIWKERLKNDNISLDDNFFDIGGHSLLLTLVNHDLRKLAGIDISMIEMFQYPTISSLAGYLKNKKQPDSKRDDNSDRKKKQMEALQRMKKTANDN